MNHVGILHIGTELEREAYPEKDLKASSWWLQTSTGSPSLFIWDSENWILVGLGSSGADRTVTGTRDDPESALANLLTTLEELGIIVDGTTPS